MEINTITDSVLGGLGKNKIIAVIILILIAGVLGYFYITNSKDETVETGKTIQGDINQGGEQTTTEGGDNAQTNQISF